MGSEHMGEDVKTPVVPLSAMPLLRGKKRLFLNVCV